MQKRTIPVEQSRYGNRGESNRIAMLKLQGYPVQVLFDEPGLKPWAWGGGPPNTAKEPARCR